MKPKHALSDQERKIGRFMVAIGAIVEDVDTKKILLVKRTDEFRPNEWEITYGRIDQHEDLDDGLRREVFEETGLKEIEIKKLVRIWHMYRGEKSADKEIHGLTFYCQVKQPVVQLSEEHSEYKWVTPVEAIALVSNPGIRSDIQFFTEQTPTSPVVLGGYGVVRKQMV